MRPTLALPSHATTYERQHLGRCRPAARMATVKAAKEIWPEYEEPVWWDVWRIDGGLILVPQVREVYADPHERGPEPPGGDPTYRRTRITAQQFGIACCLRGWSRVARVTRQQPRFAPLRLALERLREYARTRHDWQVLVLVTDADGRYDYSGDRHERRA